MGQNSVFDSVKRTKINGNGLNRKDDENIMDK
jgi:hypothetical protein